MKKLPVQGVDSAALEVLVQSWYTGSVPLSLATAPSVYDCAQKLDMPAVLAPIEQFVAGALTPSNVCSTLERCLRNGAPAALVELAVEFVKARPGEVILTADFKRAPLEIAIFVCKELSIRHTQVGARASFCMHAFYVPAVRQVRHGTCSLAMMTVRV